jgi:hypothetical protein
MAKTRKPRKAAAPLVASEPKRRSRKPKTDTGVSLVTAEGLNTWLLGYCYEPKGGKSTKLRLDRAKFQTLCEANGVWGDWADIPNGRLRMIGGIALRRRLDAGEAFNVPA